MNKQELSGNFVPAKKKKKCLADPVGMQVVGMASDIFFQVMSEKEHFLHTQKNRNLLSEGSSTMHQITDTLFGLMKGLKFLNYDTKDDLSFSCKFHEVILVFGP